LLWQKGEQRLPPGRWGRSMLYLWFKFFELVLTGVRREFFDNH
jgi:hypothetical protein